MENTENKYLATATIETSNDLVEYSTEILNIRYPGCGVDPIGRIVEMFKDNENIEYKECLKTRMPSVILEIIREYVVPKDILDDIIVLTLPEHIYMIDMTSNLQPIGFSIVDDNTDKVVHFNSNMTRDQFLRKLDKHYRDNYRLGSEVNKHLLGECINE